MDRMDRKGSVSHNPRKEGREMGDNNAGRREKQEEDEHEKRKKREE